MATMGGEKLQPTFMVLQWAPLEARTRYWCAIFCIFTTMFLWFAGTNIKFCYHRIFVFSRTMLNFAFFIPLGFLFAGTSSNFCYHKGFWFVGTTPIFQFCYQRYLVFDRIVMNFSPQSAEYFAVISKLRVRYNVISTTGAAAGGRRHWRYYHLRRICNSGCTMHIVACMKPARNTCHDGSGHCFVFPSAFVGCDVFKENDSRP